MSSFNYDLQQDLLAAKRTMDAVNEEYQEFLKACARHDWKGAEVSRKKLIDIYDGHLDQLAAAFKRLESITN